MSDPNDTRQDTTGQEATGQHATGQHATGQHATGQHAGGDAGATRPKGAGQTFTEEFRVSGEALLGKVKDLFREGNIRRITIKNDEGRTLIEIPLTIGVIGTALLPVWAAIGAIAALVANLTLAVERVDAGASTRTGSAAPPPASDAPARDAASGGDVG